MKSNIKHYLVAAGIVLAAVAPVSAQTFTFDNTGSAAGVTVTMNGGASYEGTAAGIYNGTLGSTATTVFCVDPLDNITDNQSYAANTNYSIVSPASSGGPVGTPPYYQGGLASLISGDYSTLTALQAQTRSAEIAYLCNQFLNTSLTGNQLNSTVQGNQAEDAQLAIWDIFISGGEIGTTPDQFAVQGASTSLINDISEDETQAYDYVTSNPTTTSLDNILWIQSPRSNPMYQDFAYYSSTPPTNPNNVAIPGVPEPGIGAFLGSLAVVAGIMVIAKRRSNVIA